MTVASPEMTRTSARPQRRMVLMVALPVIALMLFVVGLLSGAQGDDVLMLVLACVTLVIGAMPLVLDEARPYEKRHLFLSLYALVFVAHYVVPVFTYYVPANGPVDAPAMAYTNLMPEHVLAGQVAALIGYAGLIAGYLASGGLARRVPSVQQDWTPRANMALALFMIPTGYVITGAGQSGLIPSAFGTGVLGVFAIGYVFACALLTVDIIRYGRRLPIFILGFNLVMAFLLGLLMGRKMQMLIAPAIVVLSASILRGRLQGRWAVLGFLGVALVYPVSEFVKQELLANMSRGQILSNPGAALMMVVDWASTARPFQYLGDGIVAAGTRTDALGVTSVIIRDTPDLSPFQWGRTLGLFFVAFVPRAIWAAKPDTSIGHWITSVYGSGEHIISSTGPSQLGEWYLNFGYLGCFMGLFILGSVMRIVQETLLRHPPTTPGIVAGVVLLYYLGVKFQGAVAGTYTQVIFTIAPIFLAHQAFKFLGWTHPIGEPAGGRGPRRGGGSGGFP